ncbi:hypothetical protein [Trichothermofontia sp.]
MPASADLPVSLALAKELGWEVRYLARSQAITSPLPVVGCAIPYPRVADR